MKPKSVMLLAVALGCGLVAMLGVQQAMKKDGKPDDTVKVLVATTDIAPGVPLDDMNTKFKTMSKAAVPQGSVTSLEQFKDRSLKVGAVPDEIIMEAKLGEPGVYGASSEIPQGMRVVTVPVDLTKTHSGLIRPGDRVDVLLSYSSRVPGIGEMKKVRTVLEYIKVFATDSLRAGESAPGTDEINAKNISLLVDPQQAKRLMMANSLGPLQLALRHKKDDQPVAGDPVSMATFEGDTSSFGQEDDPFQPTTMVENAENQAARETLRAELAPTVPAVAVEPKGMWEIHIYAGGEHRVEEVEESEPTPATTI